MAPRAPFLYLKSVFTSPLSLFVLSVFFVFCGISILAIYRDSLKDGYAIPASSFIVISGFLFNSAVNSEEGAHEITNILTELYEALAVVERGCAWYEDGDSRETRPNADLQAAFPKIKECVSKLEAIYERDRLELLQGDEG